MIDVLLLVLSVCVVSIQCASTQRDHGKVSKSGSDRQPKGRPILNQFLGYGVSAGWRFSCALIRGAVKCWGNNRGNQLGGGDGIGLSSVKPVAVKGLESGVSMITSGHFHSCALKGDGSVWCWGLRSRFGFLGIADPESSDLTKPVQVKGFPPDGRVVDVKAGLWHTCVLIDYEEQTAMPQKHMMCWGVNGWGQIGNGTTSEAVKTPVFVKSPDGKGVLEWVQKIAPGVYHTCAVDTQRVYCWGSNGNYALYRGAKEFPKKRPFWRPQTLPVDVGLKLLFDASFLNSGREHSCLFSDDGFKCWGQNNHGVLGVSEKKLGSSSKLLSIPGIKGHVHNYDSNFNHVCVATADEGAAYCWGNQKGVFGAEEKGFVPPQKIGGISGRVIDVAAGRTHNCALVSQNPFDPSDSSVMCWGSNQLGELGNGKVSGTPQKKPTPVIGL